MNQFSRKIAIVATLLLAVVLPSVARGKDATAVDDAARRKAQYIFVEAINAKSQDNIDAYYDLLRYAHDVDPTNTTIAFYLGYCTMTMKNATRGHGEKALALMKPHIDAHPGDTYEATFYSDANMMLGHPDEALKTLRSLIKRYPTRYEYMSRLAKAYAASGDMVSSNEVYDSIEALHGSSIAVTINKYQNYAALNDTASALREMYHLLSTAPDNIQYNLAMGNVMEALAKRDSALYYYDRALAIDPSNGYAYLAKAQYYRALNDSVAYESLIRQALVSQDLPVDEKMGLLVKYVRDNYQPSDTLKHIDQLFDVLVEQHPHEADIHRFYSEYLLAQKDYKGAAEQLSYAIDMNPTSTDDWKRLMLINMMDENFPAAIDAGNHALANAPDSIELYMYIAPAFYQMKQYDTAIDIYNRALAMSDSLDADSRSDLLTGLGDVYHEMGDTALSYSYYQNALDINPGNTGAMNNFAYGLAVDGNRLDQAERMAALAVKGNPDNVNFVDTYAWVFFVKGDYDMALLYIKRAAELEKDNPSQEMLEHYGDILFKHGEVDEAVEKWKAALEIDPSNELLQRKINDRTYYAK